MMDQPPLGHKSPKPGYARLVYCPACRDFNSIPVLLTSRHASFLNTVIFLFRHVLENCVAVSAVREAEGIQSFLELSCRVEQSCCLQSLHSGTGLSRGSGSS